MKIKALFILLLLIPVLNSAQDFTNSWQGYFSYLDIKDISQGTNRVFGAAENAVFIYNVQTREMEKLSTINGLSGEPISTIQYDEASGVLLIGFDTGLMQVYSESTKKITTVVDILNKPSIPPVDKKINHFMVSNGFAYIATDYGISLYDIQNLEFGDTYFIGSGGGQLKVNQTTINNGFIYAATTTGMRKADASSPNLVNFQEWQLINAFNWVGVEAINNTVYALRNVNKLYELVTTNFVERASYNTASVQIKSEENRLQVTTLKQFFVYDENLTLLASSGVISEFNTDFTSGTSVNDAVYIGTKGDFNSGRIGFGILKAPFEAPLEYEEIHPDSPISNTAFAIAAADKNLWVTYGDYSVTFNPYPLRQRGFSHLKQESWVNVPFDSVLGAVNLNTINVNPLNYNQVFINSFLHGLLEVNNDIPAVLYGVNNSSFQSSSSAGIDIRNSASVIDNDGVLWCTNAKTASPLKSFNISTGVWDSYNFSAILPTANSEFGYSSLAVDDNGVKWLGGYKKGIIGFDNTGPETLLKSISSDDYNMPIAAVYSVAVDKSNTVWIGTGKGLRVIYSGAEFFSNPSFNVSSIIVLDNGTPSELLYQQFITSINVDGSNNKWIATLGTGVYYFSSDGQKTIYHFTMDNSPLPSNNVVDVALDEVNGIVYMATDKGVVSFRSDTSKTQESLEDAYVYPNPVRPSFNLNQEKVKIKGLTENVNIKITDIEGNLVTEAESQTNTKFKGYNLEVDGGTALWNGKNLAGRTVASGVYLILLSDLDSFETKVLKVMVVR
ncbi:ABC transporter substrate-binding protein [Bizionia gelidisalsuginis]|uniref:ABC transporter substrate-binding protein n=1 Tax=Bizionia gelidisalsuginis TaxID=291188 RepID=A0ABY3MB01_9FLAO|nr:ABC transporter substrate-binding protein [Bizionia gelidisalsuginis]TYC13477.1 ABC transporter substrate-binding protein [Bizionia gelidisalsuginis]